MTDAEITLEPEGLEAAVHAYGSLNGIGALHPEKIERAIRAYLSRSTLPREGQPTGWRLGVEASDLLPCPFCGGEAKVWPDEVGSGGQHVSPYHAGCPLPRCGICFTEEERADAIAAWNSRSTLPREGQGEGIDWGDLLAGYQRICSEHGIEPTSGDVLAALKRHDAGDPISPVKPFCYTASLNLGPRPVIASYFQEGIYTEPLYRHPAPLSPSPAVRDGVAEACRALPLQDVEPIGYRWRSSEDGPWQTDHAQWSELRVAGMRHNHPFFEAIYSEADFSSVVFKYQSLGRNIAIERGKRKAAEAALRALSTQEQGNG